MQRECKRTGKEIAQFKLCQEYMNKKRRIRRAPCLHYFAYAFRLMICAAQSTGLLSKKIRKRPFHYFFANLSLCLLVIASRRLTLRIPALYLLISSFLTLDIRYLNCAVDQVGRLHSLFKLYSHEEKERRGGAGALDDEEATRTKP
ncbi:MAG: hypothetical protein IJ728_10850 [Selenomonadaceae bacterium]|nr:hypothetical protein [Selenomonadaceae bacterium]